MSGPRPASGAGVTTARSTRARAGCGCIGPLVALVISLAAVAIFGAVSLFGAVDDASDDGEIQDEGVLRIGVPDRGGIGTGDTVRWRLDGRGGEFRFDVRAEGDFDPKIEVRQVGGRSLGSDDDSGGPGDRDSRLVVRLEEGVDYEVDVTGFGDSSGDYEIEVTSTDVPPVEGGSLSIRGPVDGTVVANGSVRYRFTGEGREVTIRAHGHDGFDPVVRVIDEGGGVLGEDDDGGEGRDSLLRVTVAGGATVVVEVRGFEGDEGRYTVGVT